MTRLLSRLFGRLPIGWLQLTQNRTRMFAAIAGVVFANVLVFVQLGILGSLNTSIVAGYQLFDADILISAKQSHTLYDGVQIPRQRMFQALSVPKVASAAALYLGKATWTPKEGEPVKFQLVGIDPASAEFLAPGVATAAAGLHVADTALLDTRARNLEPARVQELRRAQTVRFELQGRLIAAVDEISVGAGFGSDGALVVSDQTFFGLDPRRSSAAPDHIFINVSPGAPVNRVIRDLQAVFPADELQVRTLADAARGDQLYQTTQRPTGLIFGFGVVIGVLVGVIIVYQILSSDVADHLKEYATFKAMGYERSFFVGVVLEEALVLAVLGFVPSLLLSVGSYQLLGSLTVLPIAMTWPRAIAVFLGTILACSLSGAIATRKLTQADPADLFS